MLSFVLSQRHLYLDNRGIEEEHLIGEKVDSMVRSLLSRFTLRWYEQFLVHRWLKQHSVTARTCRVTVEVAQETRQYRLIYVGHHSELQSCEDEAEAHFREWLEGLGEAVARETRWTKCHLVISETFSSESESIQLLVQQLRRNNSRFLFTVHETNSSSDATGKRTVSPLTSA